MNSWALARLRRVFDLGDRRIVAAVRDVVAHRSVEQEDVLLDDREQIAVGCEPEVADVRAVEEDASARRIVEARDEIGDRRLAGAAPAHQRDDRPAGHGDVEIEDDRLALAVLELDVLEPDLIDDARRVACVRPVRLVVLHPEHLEHALHRRQRSLELGERVHDVPDRPHQQHRCTTGTP